MAARVLAPFKLLAALVAFAGLGLAPAGAAGIGVVLLHAGTSWPGQFDRLVPRLEAAGYGAIAPEACWSVHRIYGGTVEECQADVDNAIAALRDKGYDRFVVAGHDLGALNALYYGDGHPGLAGIIVWGPNRGGRGGSDVDVDDAETLVKAGNGDKPANFSNGYVYTTPRALLSFRGPDSPLADETKLLANISAPLLWVAPNDDLGPRDSMPRFKQAPANPLNAYIRSTTDFFSMVDVSAPDVIAWLDKVKAADATR